MTLFAACLQAIRRNPKKFGVISKANLLPCVNLKS